VNANSSHDRPRFAWVLNLDAEHELEVVRPFTPSDHLRALVERESRRLIGTLVGPNDIVLDERDRTNGERRARGLLGLAWSPTPRALALLHAAGATPLGTPAVEILREVNARPFAARLRTEHAPGSFEKFVVASLDEALARLALPASLGWLVRRSFGAAGRGRRRLRSGRPDDGELAWLVASLRTGPLVIEPWVEVTREYTRSGWIAPDGSVSISAPCLQTVAPSGAWTGTERDEARDVSREDDLRLAEMFERAGRELARVGYFGPFGIDAYRHRTPGGGEALNPLSEINARFTMDWATALSPDPRRADGRGAVERWIQIARRPGLALAGE